MPALSNYRTVGETSDHAFADWVKALRGRSGVYVICSRSWWSGSAKRCLYIGESHSGRLYETLTRHFQKWTGPQEDTSWLRDEVVVAVKLCEPANAIVVQDAMICAMDPTLNKQRNCPRTDKEEREAFDFGASDPEHIEEDF